MLPTFEPDDMLRRSLKSVLSQAFPPDQMQIAVIDDGSRRGNVAKLVRSIDPTGCVQVHVDGPHLGLGGNWNRAIDLAQGHLVHLLHQDDVVLPGFYARMDRWFRLAPHVGMAFCRSRIVDDCGHFLKTNSRLRWRPGVLANWLPRIALRQRIQTPAAVVARSTYEAIGGYRTDLRHTLDWEMWVRIAARYAVWYDPATLALFRRHAASETSRLLAEGAVWPDLADAIRLNADWLSATDRRRVSTLSIRWYAGSALREAGKLVSKSDYHAAWATLVHARGLLAMISEDRQRRPLEKRAATLEQRLNSARRAA